MASFTEIFHDYVKVTSTQPRTDPIFPGGGKPGTYLQKAYDSGTAGWVYWTTLGFETAPATSITTPTYTGTLSGYAVVRLIDPSD